MATPVTMPMLGLTMEEGTVAEWLKAEGEAVAKDEPLLTVEMDKGTVEVPSPAAGVLRRIVVQPGTTVPVRTLIAEIGSADEVLAPETSATTPAGGPGDLPRAEASRAEAATASTAAPLPPPSSITPDPSREASRDASSGASPARQRLFASPRARLRARESGIELTTLRGSGPHGRIVEADVLAATGATASRVTATPLARRLAEEHGVSIADLRGSGPGGRITQEDVLRAAATQPMTTAVPAPAAGQPPSTTQVGVQPLSRIRRITAERMAASSGAAARVTLFLDADFTEATHFRSQLQPEFERLGVARLPWDAIIAKAAALALGEHTSLLAQWVEGQGLQRHEAVNVGVAVTLEPEGLVVPVLRDADKRSLRDLARELLELVGKARAGRLSPGEMQGGSFSITNLGGYRIDGFTPILNPPETAILGVGRIADKAVVINGALAVRTMCTLSLSFDHRVVDGAPAAAFLARLAELLERPYALLGI
jgi:pyruvate dehydrogenase E2 component (dihydrolipoyllysine-residue acetyltransferase)